MVEIATLDKFISAADIESVTFRQRLLAAASWEHLSNPIGIRLYMCPHTAIYVSSYCYMCPHTAIYVFSYCYICVLILLCMCPHTAIYVSPSATAPRSSHLRTPAGT
jgi:hypothetical protein